jgi:hypothetical protein
MCQGTCHDRGKATDAATGARRMMPLERTSAFTLACAATDGRERYVGLGSQRQTSNELRRQRDIALGERNEYLRQRDIAVGERNEYIRQRDKAIAERPAFVRDDVIAEVAKERDRAKREAAELRAKCSNLLAKLEAQSA